MFPFQGELIDPCSLPQSGFKLATCFSELLQEYNKMGDCFLKQSKIFCFYLENKGSLIVFSLGH